MRAMVWHDLALQPGPSGRRCGKEKLTGMVLTVVYKSPELHVELCDVLGFRTI